MKTQKIHLIERDLAFTQLHKIPNIIISTIIDRVSDKVSIKNTINFLEKDNCSHIEGIFFWNKQEEGVFFWEDILVNNDYKKYFTKYKPEITKCSLHLLYYYYLKDGGRNIKPINNLLKRKYTIRFSENGVWEKGSYNRLNICPHCGEPI